MNTKKPLTFAILTALTLSASPLLAEKSTSSVADPSQATSSVAGAIGENSKSTVSGSDSEKSQAPFFVDQGDAIKNEQAIEALTRIKEASKAIDKKDIKVAQSELEAADKLLKSIKNSLPVAKVKKVLEAAKQNPNSADWTSIYQQLDEVMVFLPATVMKNTKKDEKTTDAKSATPASTESIDAVLVALQYTEIDMPVSTAISLVEKAQSALQKENLKSASKALSDAQQSVVILQSLAEEPLFQAHLSLWQALANMKNGAEAEAKHYLDNAISYLEAAAKSTDKETKKAADKLLIESKEFKNELTKGADKSSSEVSSLDGKLERLGLHTEAWAERAINYAYTKASETVSSNLLKEDLIEARFHLSNALIDLSTLKEPDSAKTEIGQAQTYIKQALQKKDALWKDSNVKKHVNELHVEIDKLLKNTPELSSASSVLHKVRQELQTVIHKL